MNFLFYLESIRTPFLTNLFRFLTFFGEEAFILVFLCSIYWCYNKKLAYRLCFSYFLSGLCIQILKITFRIPRPWIKSPEFHPVKEATKTATGYSFPSGHTQSATASYTTLAFFYKKTTIIIGAVFLIAGVALSRMYLGVHTPQDVLCSFFITFLLTLAVNSIFDRINLTKQKSLYIAIGLFFISIITIFYSILLIRQGTVPIEQGADCYKAGGAGIGFAIGWFIESNYINFNEKPSSIKTGSFRLFLGALVAILIKVGWKNLFGQSIPSDILRYGVLVLWLTTLYPAIIKRCSFLA